VPPAVGMQAILKIYNIRDEIRVVIVYFYSYQSMTGLENSSATFVRSESMGE
jgi:hypothetical protein